MADTSSITTTEPLLPTLLVIQPTVHTTNSVKLKFGVFKYVCLIKRIIKNVPFIYLHLCNRGVLENENQQNITDNCNFLFFFTFFVADSSFENKHKRFQPVIV